MTAAPTVKNCVEIVKPFRDDLERAGLLDEVQFIGGIGSAALADEATVIRPEEGIVVAPEGLHLPSRRDDGNKRDMDVLVLSTDRGRIDEVEGMAEEAVGDQLEISVFGLKDGTHVEKQLRHPVFGWKALKTFTGDRYVSEFAGETFMEKVLFPFAVPIPAESMDSGRLEVDGVWLPIATPPGALMNYVTRSVSGIRAKDADKLERMASNVFGQVPDYVDWVRTGPGKNLLELARVLHSLQGPSSFEAAETHVMGGAVAIEPLPIRALMQHEAFMLRDFDKRTQENALAWARVKSAALSKAESYEEVVRLYQKWAEKLFDGITKNT